MTARSGAGRGETIADVQQPRHGGHERALPF